MSAATDIELCNVTDAKTKEKLMNLLVKAGIPYAERWDKVPLMKRKHFNGVKEVCVIITHREQVHLARTVIDRLDEETKRNIIW